jgi:hypothetical protein
VAAGKFTRFFNFMANMGLVIRDDPPKVIDMTGREWGETVEGLALSIREIRKQDPGELATISVVMRNNGPQPRKFTMPGWLFFYEMEVVAADGSRVGLTPYGSRLMKQERAAENIQFALGPGEATETDLPLATLYDLRARGSYRVRVSCRAPEGGLLASNEIVVRA